MLYALAAAAISLTSPVYTHQICQQYEVCEYTGGTHEECHVNRRGQRVCNIIAEQACTTEYVCYQDGPNDQPCYGIVDYDELIACLQG